MFDIKTGDIKSPTVKTSNYGGLSADDIAEICTNKIISVAETAPPAIREQAKFFKDNLQLVLKVYINQAMESQRDRDIQTCIRGGHSEAADILRRS